MGIELEEKEGFCCGSGVPSFLFTPSSPGGSPLFLLLLSLADT